MLFNNLQSIDPLTIAAELLESEPAVPVDPWLGMAGRYINPISLRHGSAYLIFSRAQLESIPAWSQRYPLVFSGKYGDVQQAQSCPNFRIVGTPVCIAPANRGYGHSPYLVELADRRIDCIGVCGKRYNWRIHPDSTYETASLNAGSAWTYAGIAQDLWEQVGCLSTWPGLPSGVTVSETPEQIDGMGCMAAPLLEDFLMVHGMGVRYDHVRDTFAIVHFSSGATACANNQFVDNFLGNTGALLRRYDDRLVWDKETLLDPLAKLPQYVRVAFPVWSPGGAPIDTATYWVRDVADGANDQTNIASTFAVIQDFMALRTNQQGVAVNASTIQTRAAAIAGWFFQRARRARTMPFHRVYGGLLTDADAMPGEAIDLVIWEDVGGGLKTHLIQTGRLGFAGIQNLSGGAKTTGELITGHPQTTYYRSPSNQTAEGYPIRRAAGLAPGEARLHGGEPMADLIDGYGVSSLLDRFGPLRQWDAAVQALAVDGHGQRLWKAARRVQQHSFVKVTSITAVSGRYPAKEVNYDPAGATWTDGDVVSYIAADGGVPTLNSYHLCYLAGTDGAGTPKKVYEDASAGTGTELKGLTFTSDTSSTADSDPGNGKFKWNNATQASATVLYFDNLTADGVTSATFFASLAANGFLYLQQSDDSTKWQMWKWAALPVAGAGYYKFTVTLQANGGSIADAKTVYTMFANANNFAAQEVDGTPSTATTLKFPNTSLTDNGDGTVTVKSASGTEIGFINLSNQVMGTGNKIFGIGTPNVTINGAGISLTALVGSTAETISMYDSEDPTVQPAGSWIMSTRILGATESAWRLTVGAGASGSVTGATNATPIVITTSISHTLVTGDTVTITGVGGNTAANGGWVITVLTATTFSLNTSVGNGAYTSGGTWSCSRLFFVGANGVGPTQVNRFIVGSSGDIPAVNAIYSIHKVGTGILDGATGTFTTVDLKTVTVTGGIITSII